MWDLQGKKIYIVFMEIFYLANSLLSGTVYNLISCGSYLIIVQKSHIVLL